MALVRITEDKRCALVATLNFDATDPIQGESYGNAWSIPIDEASASFRKNGFWQTWIAINDTVSGCITLDDGMNDREASAFMKIGKVPSLHGDSEQLATLITLLPVGEFLFHVEDQRTNTPTLKKNVSMKRADFERYNELLDIDVFGEDTEKEEELEAMPNSRETICKVEFDDGVMLTLYLVSGMHNYYIDTIFEKDNVQVGSDDPGYILSENESFSFDGKTYELNFVLNKTEEDTKMDNYIPFDRREIIIVTRDINGARNELCFESREALLAANPMLIDDETDVLLVVWGGVCVYSGLDCVDIPTWDTLVGFFG